MTWWYRTCRPRSQTSNDWTWCSKTRTRAPAAHAGSAFDRAADGVVLASNTRYLRQLDTATRRVRLLAVQEGGDRELGTYTFNHSRYGA
jgi:hypothetical protein